MTADDELLAALRAGVMDESDPDDGTCGWCGTYYCDCLSDDGYPDDYWPYDLVADHEIASLRPGQPPRPETTIELPE